MSAAALIGLGAAGAAGGAYYERKGRKKQEKAVNRAIEGREDFSSQANDTRRSMLDANLAGLGDLQSTRTGVLSQGLSGIGTAGPSAGSGYRDIRGMAGNGQIVPALQAQTADQQRVAAGARAQSAPLIQAQQGAQGSQLEALQRGADRQNAMRLLGLNLQDVGRQTSRFQNNAALDTGEIDLIDYLNSLEYQRQLQAAQGAGASDRAAGGLLGGVGGAVLGTGIGDLF